MKKTALIALVAIVALTGCKGTKNVVKKDNSGDMLVEANKDNSKPDNNIIHTIDGTWIITEAGGLKADAALDDEKTPTLTIDIADSGAGQIYCFTGCNYINGDIVYKAGGMIEPLGNYMSTLMACHDGAEAFEANVKEAINNMRQLSVSSDATNYTITICDEAGNALMKARRWDTNFINGAWEVTGIGDAQISSSEDIQLVIDLTTGMLHGNTGCNVFNGTIRTLPDHKNGLEISDIAVTKRLCHEPKATYERELLVALENASGCQPTEMGEGAILTNDEGKTLIKLHKLVLQR